jgi:alpha-beta hydrolase superfamily lysophospholipase
MIPAATLFEPMPIKAVGATLRAARFEAAPDVPARGTCVLLNGQTEFIEKYFEVIDELRGRGFAVATMDWRGQGGSGRMTEDSRKRPAKSRWPWPIRWARIFFCAAWCGSPPASAHPRCPRP